MSGIPSKEPRKLVNLRKSIIKRVDKLINRRIVFHEGFLNGMLYLVDFSSPGKLTVTILSTESKSISEGRCQINNLDLFKERRYYGDIRYPDIFSKLTFAGDLASTTYGARHSLLEFYFKLKPSAQAKLEKAFSYYTTKE